MFRLCLSALGGCFHPPVETGGIEIGRINYNMEDTNWANRITPTFSRLMKKVGICAPKGTGFYALRRTAATMAARSGDPFAVQRLLGHVDLTMATRYV